MLTHDPDAPDLTPEEMEDIEAERSDERYDREIDDALTRGE